MHHPRARPRRCMVRQTADRRPQNLLGCARLRLLGRLILSERSSLMNKWIFAAATTLIALSSATSASAQARSLEGFAMPVIYDSHGAQHYFANGYYGIIMPAMPGNEASSL